MSFSFPEPLDVDGVVYQLYAYPLDGFLQDRPGWPRFAKWPCNTRGYSATWAIVDEHLCLTSLSAPVANALAALFPDSCAPVPATWVDGIVKASRGTRRHVGYPPRVIHDAELYVELHAGKIVREWRLDLRDVPDQSDDKLKLSLPRFLWPSRLRDEVERDSDGVEE